MVGNHAKWMSSPQSTHESHMWPSRQTVCPPWSTNYITAELQCKNLKVAASIQAHVIIQNLRPCKLAFAIAECVHL